MLLLPIKNIKDGDIHALVLELHHATAAPIDDEQILFNFLQVCYDPYGERKWRRLTKNDLNPQGGLLRAKLCRLGSSGIRQLCTEILKGGSLELYEETPLYEFLNKCLPHPWKKTPKEKPTKGQTLKRMGF